MSGEQAAEQLLKQVTQECDDWRAEASRLHEAGNGLITQLNAAQAEIERLTEERDNWQQRAKALADALETAAQRMAVDRSHLTEERDAAMAERGTAMAAVDQLATQRDAALADVRAQLAANRVIIEERDVAEKERTESRAEVVGLTEERDTWQQRAKALADALETAAQRMTVDRSHLIEERDAARKEADITEILREGALEERDAAWEERDVAEEKCRKLRAENEGLRADLLAHPPQQIDFQQATIIETLRETLTRTEAILEEAQGKIAMLESQCQSADAIMQGLRECLERTDKRLSQAKARQIPPALVGLLGVIRREAAAAEKMISQS